MILSQRIEFTPLDVGDEEGVAVAGPVGVVAEVLDDLHPSAGGFLVEVVNKLHVNEAIIR